MTVSIAGIATKSTKENKTGSWRSQRPIVDEDKCISCNRCVQFCPENCIKLNPKAEVNYDYCKGCGICANECPVKAIAMEEEKCSKKK